MCQIVFFRIWATTLLAIVMVLSSCRKKTDLPYSYYFAENKNHLLLPVTHYFNDAFGGYYIALPHDYFDTTGEYPLLVFLHGLGQAGNGNTELHYITYDGIGKLLKEIRFPPVFSVNGTQHAFIVVSPQSSRQPAPMEVLQVIEHIKQVYRVNRKRVYLSGLSMGAGAVTLAAAAFPDSLAAIVPIAGVALNSGMKERCRRIAQSNLPVWQLHNADDPMAKAADARRFIGYISAFHPSVPPLLTVFDAYGHDAWTRALDPSFKENGMNIYEWMLQFSR